MREGKHLHGELDRIFRTMMAMPCLIIRPLGEPESLSRLRPMLWVARSEVWCNTYSLASSRCHDQIKHCGHQDQSHLKTTCRQFHWGCLYVLCHTSSLHSSLVFSSHSSVLQTDAKLVFIEGVVLRLFKNDLALCRECLVYDLPVLQRRKESSLKNYSTKTLWGFCQDSIDH